MCVCKKTKLFNFDIGFPGLIVIITQPILAKCILQKYIRICSHARAGWNCRVVSNHDKSNQGGRQKPSWIVGR